LIFPLVSKEFQKASPQIWIQKLYFLPLLGKPIQIELEFSFRISFLSQPKSNTFLRKAHLTGGLYCQIWLFWLETYVTRVLHIPSRTSTGCVSDTGTVRVRIGYGYVPGTSRGVLNHFNRFDRPIRSPVWLGTAGCGSGTAECSQTQKIKKIKCMSEI
jgi:hypothetical protein